MTAFLQTLRNLGVTRLAILGAVGLGLLGFFVFFTARMSGGEMALLYGDLSPTDASAITARLDGMGVPYTLGVDGTQVSVPADRAQQLRMTMAQEGLPNGGSIGYEIFDTPEGFGTTSFIQNINHLRALEGELARTVGTLAPVQQARVHLVLPRRELFSRDPQTATASVFLRLRPGAQLGREQILAIQHLMAASVPQLDPSQVSIIDDRGNLLARGMGAGSPELMTANAEEMRRTYEQRMARTIEDLLSRTLGYGRVRAEVAADLDFDRITTNSEIFDPDSQVVRSTQTVEESSEAIDSDGVDPVTVNNNLPGADDTNGLAGTGSSNRSNRTEETVNFEISRTTTSHVRESGQVRRMSVAVLVDGIYETGADGTTTYTPRTEQEIEQISALVRSAIGYDAVRGDTVEVVNMRFVTAEDAFADTPETSFFGLGKQDLFRIAEMAVLGIVAVLVILLVVRPLIARMLDAAPAGGDGDVPDRALPNQSVPQAALAAPAGALAQDLALEAAQAENEFEAMIDINRVEGRVRASSLRKVGEIVERHPEEAVSIIRNWMYQET